MSFAADRLKRQTGLTPRQLETLTALVELAKGDPRSGEWRGAFGSAVVSRYSQSTPRKVQNDFEALVGMGYVARKLNGLFKITEKGIGVLTKTSPDAKV